ncbi:MAG: hypothetical protein ACYTHN_04000 [Planctomycetota bacterium]
MESASAQLRDALQAILRPLLAENLEALRESGDLPGPEAMAALSKGMDPDELREMVREEIRSALEEVRVPTEEVIAEIARREVEGAEGPKEMEEEVKNHIQAELDEKLSAFADSQRLLEEIEGKMNAFRDEMTAIESQEEDLQNRIASLFESDTFKSALDTRVGEQMLSEDSVKEIVRREVEENAPEGGGDGVSPEQIDERVKEALAEWTEKLEDRVKGDFESMIVEKLEDVRKDLDAAGGGDGGDMEQAVASALEKPEIREALSALVKEQTGQIQPNMDDLTEPMAVIASKTTEKILAREAEGLVRQIKIELGKIRNEMKKSWDQTVALVKSPEMEKHMQSVSKKLFEKELNEIREELKTAETKSGGGPDAEQLKEVVEEISARVAEDISQESLKGFLEELRSRVESGIETRLNEFMASDTLKDSVSTIARQVAPPPVVTGEGGEVNSEGVRQIVADEIMRRTEEAFKDLIPRYVGKFLDDKLPPPEFFESLATLTQVQQEIEKRLKGSRSGSGSGRAFAGPGPGDSAIFSNVIGRILGSDELKEMIDDKFRVINNYVKNELVPKTVKKMLKED